MAFKVLLNTMTVLLKSSLSLLFKRNPVVSRNQTPAGRESLINCPYKTCSNTRVDDKYLCTAVCIALR